ncbi:hypothetical protein IGI04_014043 [Brassica rapa subsp. trilocularis]|uniref:Uncharacterized protein n=1 Tax=Brassica rapa subsp. trilocularis TaxID=1813537 RepID=A0ABQ7NDU5_BRACM|nr:hypothetical protein IGI04_014043 [Brassica rapa subsp. trilocularis]
MFVGSEPPEVFTRAARCQNIAKLVIIICSPTTIVILSSRRSRSHQPRRNRSPNEAARAFGSFASAPELHAQLPEIVAAALTAVLRCRTAAMPPSTAVLRRLSPPSSALRRRRR